MKESKCVYFMGAAGGTFVSQQAIFIAFSIYDNYFHAGGRRIVRISYII